MLQAISGFEQSGADQSAAPTLPKEQRTVRLRSRLGAMVLLAIVTLMLVVTVSAVTSHRSGLYAQQVFVAKDVTADILPPPMYLVEMRLVLSRAVEGTLDASSARQEVDRLAKEYDARYEYWRANPPKALGELLLGEQHQAALAFRKRVDEKLANLSGDPETVKAKLVEAQASYDLHRAAVDRTVEASLKLAAEAQSDFDTSLARGWQVQVFIALLAVFLYASVGSRIGRSVWRSVGGEPSQAAAMAKAVSMGELRHEVQVRPGDTTSVMAAMGEMCSSLADLAKLVRTRAVSIASSSREIAVGNQDLSERTQKQASALQATASAVEELCSTVASNAENASVANDLARQATQMAHRGGEEVRQVVSTMGEIQTSSQRIGEIVGIIDAIAFQTNILALNASVEAARAGESGRGFAVVASEVRSLAGKSAEAAREIKALVSTSLAHSEQGAVLVNRAGDTVTTVVQAIERVSVAVHEITAASREQSDGLKVVAQSVHEMDHATQANAALVEQAAAAAESLRDDSAQLVDAVAVFKTRS